MHMKVIYATESKEEAEKIVKRLRDGFNLTDDIFEIDEPELQDLIPEADYVTVDAIKNGNTYGKLNTSEQEDAKKFISEYFNSDYFDFAADDYYIKASQKTDAVAKCEKQYEEALNKALKISHLVGMPIVNSHFWDKCASSGKNYIKQLKDAGLDPFDVKIKLESFDDSKMEYQPAIIIKKDDYNERLGSDATKVEDEPKNYYVFPQIISDFHC